MTLVKDLAQPLLAKATPQESYGVERPGSLFGSEVRFVRLARYRGSQPIPLRILIQKGRMSGGEVLGYVLRPDCSPPRLRCKFPATDIARPPIKPRSASVYVSLI